MKAKQSSELGPVDTLDKAIEAWGRWLRVHMAAERHFQGPGANLKVSVLLSCVV